MTERALAPPWRDGSVLLLVLIAAGGALHLLIRTSSYGPALGMDSLHYLSVAESFAAGHGLRNVRGYASDQPPLLPMLLGLASLSGIEPVDAGRFVNAAAFGLTILITGILLRRQVGSRFLVPGAAAVVMTSFYVADVFSYVLTDSLFTLLVMLALAPLGTRPGPQGGRRALALSAVFAALAMATRYLGVTVIITAIVVILTRPRRPGCSRWKDAAAYALVASAPFAALLAYRWLEFGTLMGQKLHARSGQSVLDSFRDVAGSAGRTFFPWTPGIEHLVPPAGWGAALILLGCTVFFLACRRRGALPAFDAGPLLPFGWFALVYLVALPLVAPVTTSAGILIRYLPPAFVPVLLVAVFGLDLLLRCTVGGAMRVFQWALVVPVLAGCAANVGFNVHRNLEATSEALEAGYNEANNLNAARWTESGTGEYLEAHPLPGPLYTNLPPVLWWLADVRPPIGRVRNASDDDCRAWLRRAVAAYRRDSKDEASRLRRVFAEMERNWESGEAHVVWVETRRGVSHWCNVPDSSLPPGLERVAGFSDGAVYRFVPADDPQGAARARR